MTEFYTVSGYKRPERLKEETRRFAYDSLHCRYGLQTDRTPAVSLDDVRDYDNLTPTGKHDLAIRRIAQNAPVRICEGEMISGAATLGLAIKHRIPATRNGEPVFESISHLTIDFDSVIKRGVDAISDDIRKSLSEPHSGREKEFLHSCENVMESFRIWHGRYLEALKDDPSMRDNYNNLLKVPFGVPETFYEAVQSIWSVFAFTRLCGNWPGIGRIDLLLGDFLRRDLELGILDIDKAREILAHFFIKGCEWIKGGDYGSGDAQHYQNIVLSGTDGNGRDITNEVTYLVLDIIEELGISDFPVTVRLSRKTPEKLYRRAAEVLRLGGGILAFYSEDTVMKALKDYGYPESEAWKFANDGCWEVQIPGKTFFNYQPFDMLQLLQNDVMNRTDCSSFEEVLDSFNTAVERKIREICEIRYGMIESFDDRLWKEMRPCMVVSLFEDGCIRSGRSYLEGGPVYNVISPHAGGLPDAVNSLYAIKKLVFEEKRVTFRELKKILDDNWEGHEELRLHVSEEYIYFGNDNDECDDIAVRVIDSFAGSCRKYEKEGGYSFPPGISTFGRQIDWLPKRQATASGHRKGDILAGNCSPTPGSDREGATAVIRSYCKADLSKMTTGAALDLKLLPQIFRGEDGIAAIISLLRGFVSLGGFFIQPDVESPEVLKDAQEHPEKYPTLSVRVSGWNARFVTLDRQWQDMIIQQTEGMR